MNDSSTYKFISFILLIVVIILGFMLFLGTDKGEPAAEGVRSAAESLNECRMAVASWTARWSTTTVSSTARAELDNILKDCQQKVGEAR